MSDEKEDLFYLKHILNAIEDIEDYLRNVSYSEFEDNKLLQDAVIRKLEIIGEAVKNISEDLKSQTQHIPWKAIAGMRDKLIHHYFGVDIFAVWKTATEDIKLLKRDISELLKNV